MKKLLFLGFCLAFVASVSAVAAQNFISHRKVSLIYADSNSDDMHNFSTFSQQSNFSSTYQQNFLTFRATNVSQPHILTVKTSGAQLQGEITLDGKIIKLLNSNQVEINLSPFLSVGEHQVKISGRYSPVSSSASITLSGPGTNVMQQTSGNGILYHVINMSIH
jgi:hypothetical protein